MGMGRIGRRGLLRLLLMSVVGAGGAVLSNAISSSESSPTTLPPAMMAERLKALAADYLAGTQVLTLDEEAWPVPRQELGLTLVVMPPEPEVAHLAPLASHWGAAVVATVDRDRLAARLRDLPGVARPIVDATLTWTDGSVTLTPDQPGRQVDLAALAAALAERARHLDDSPLGLPVVPVSAAVTAAHLAPVADWLRRILARPLRLETEDAGMEVPPAAIAGALVWDETNGVQPDARAWASLLAPLAAALAVAPREPRLIVESGQARVAPGVPGQRLDTEATVEAIWTALRAAEPAVSPVLQPVPPRRTATDWTPSLAQAKRLLARPPVLIADDHEWPLTAVDLARLLRGDSPTLTIDAAAADDLLRVLATWVAVAPTRPLYRWRDGAAVADGAGLLGRRLDQAAARSRLIEDLTAAKAAIVLPVVDVAVPEPPAGLEFPDLLAEGRTYVADSVRDRYRNVALGLDRIDGVLVPPGGRFSFNQATGPVTLANGFRPGYGIAISNGRVTTVPSVGGGICQVATTLFHAVFQAGLPVEERNWHSYWMPRYGRPPSGMVGLDATVDDQSGLDFIFRNRTEHWLLIEAVIERGDAVVRLRGIAPDWQVEIAPPVVTNVVRANRATVERPDPSLPRGTRRQVEHAEDGKTVAIRRVVRDGHGRLLEQRVFTARYVPASNLVLVGTGSRNS